MFVTLAVTLLFNHKLLHTFEILIEAYFCVSYNKLLSRQTSQVVAPLVISEVCQWCNFWGEGLTVVISH